MSDDLQINAALDAIQRMIEPRAIVGVHLYGSAVAGGLRPGSDIDLFVLVSRRLSRAERRNLVQALRSISRRSLRPKGWRPLEVTVVAQPDVMPWRYPPTLDLQYGEWLDDAQLSAAIARGATESPDLGVVVEMVRTTGRPLIGLPPREVLDCVPMSDLARAMLDELPSLLDDLDDDTRNVLLTLARMWCTVTTGAFQPKDTAAEWACARLPDAQRPLLATARDLYREGEDGVWDRDAVRDLAGVLVARIRSEATSG